MGIMMIAGTEPVNDVKVVRCRTVNSGKWFIFIQQKDYATPKDIGTVTISTPISMSTLYQGFICASSTSGPSLFVGFVTAYSGNSLTVRLITSLDSGSGGSLVPNYILLGHWTVGIFNCRLSRRLGFKIQWCLYGSSCWRPGFPAREFCGFTFDYTLTGWSFTAGYNSPVSYIRPTTTAISLGYWNSGDIMLSHKSNRLSLLVNSLHPII